MEGGSLWHEFETDLPAADVWEVYGSLALGQLVPQLLPHVLSKVELVEGDGGVGTVLLVTFPPAGASEEPRSYKEKFNVVDHEKYIKEAEIVEGDGGVGTVLLVTFPPAGASEEPRSYKEKFNVVDHEKYIKEAEIVEGGFLDLRFRKYLVRFEVVGKEDGRSVIRSTVEYEVDAEHAKNASLVSTEALAAVAEAITKHIKEQKSPKQAKE
ncbi:hypothetical protein ZWY2020_012308 [Hordeum vulgare]|nr:hypothetical protein ZWY2020_012308 [Hordeum vulgare]